MKQDEINFFKLCLANITTISKEDGIKHGDYTPREIINIIDVIIPHKRCWYYLRKWNRFYNYGVSEDVGWIEIYNLYGEYKKIYDDGRKTGLWK